MLIKQYVCLFLLLTDEALPRAPNKFTPLIALRAAYAIPIEEEFNSGSP